MKITCKYNLLDWADYNNKKLYDYYPSIEPTCYHPLQEYTYCENKQSCKLRKSIGEEE